MKTLCFFTSSVLLLLVAVLATDELSLSDALKDFEWGNGITDLGRDGVLRSLTPERDTAVDYVQLSENQIVGFLEKLGKKAKVYSGIDGRNVTSEAQLWAVPDDIEPPEPVTKPRKPDIPRALLEGQLALDCDPGANCTAPEDCHPYCCSRCIRDQECIGGPTSCVRPAPACAFDL